MNYRLFKIFLFSLFSLVWTSNSGLAQKTTINMYEKEWQTIDSLDQSGLPQSALEALNALAEKVNPATEADQYLKIIFYRAKFITQTSEDGLVKAIAEIEAVERSAAFPVKPILQSILGQFYQSYLDAVIWEIQDRTTVEAQPDDFRTWSVQDLVDKSTALYEASIDPKEQLTAISITAFPEIIDIGKLSDGLRHTVYDVLAHRAIDNFTNEKNYLTQPSYQFTLDQEKAFEEAGVFSELQWNTRDTGSHKLKAIQILQDLIQMHLQDESPEALVDVDLKRLGLMYDYATLDNKNELYLQALKKLQEKYVDNQAAAEVIYHIAKQYYAEGAGEINSLNEEENKWRYKEAFDLCGSCIEQYPESYGAQLCSNLRQLIQQASLSLEMERVNLPEQPLLVSVSYRNVKELHLRVVRLDDRDEDALRRRYDQNRMDFLLNLKPVQTKSYELPDPGDFRSHNTEVALDGLELGRYAVLASEDAKFGKQNVITSVTYIYVSQIGYFQRRGEEGAQQFVLMNRKDGAPMDNVLAEYFISEYSSKKKAYDLIKIGEQFSDEDGMITAKASPRNYWTVKFSKGEDVLYLNDNYRNYGSSRNQRGSYQTTQFFLDRAIYRPGQTIFFKGIILENDEASIPSIVPNKKVTLTLFDANNQELDQLELTTNEYGTFNGRFKTPTSVLLGRMRIRSDVGSGSTSFRVEEYKRPKFEVSLQDLEKSYSLGEEVLIKGTAEGFAGNAIDGAQVNYRVYRSVRYPWLPWWVRMPSTRGNTEIGKGTIQTNENGAFEFTFEALPDLNADRDQKPVFRFSVEVDVVDITGETHSDSRTFNLGYVGLEAEVKIAEELDKTQDVHRLELSTTSLDGSFLPASGQLTVYQLDAPDRFFINRYWNEPDIYLMDKETYRKDFPYIAYDGEDKSYNWNKIEKQLELPFNTAESKEVELDVSKWPVGHYALDLTTKDEAGNELSRTYTFVVYDSKAKNIPANIEWWSTLNNNQFEPGEKMVYQLASNETDKKVLLEVEHQNKIIRQEWITIKKWETVSESVKETFRGGFLVYVTAMAHNRPLSSRERIQVPWSNKKLNITYGTFRDKLRPGQEEEWQLIISGPDKEKVAAEMLVSMYDASLDQFVKHSWSFDPYPNFSYGALGWSPRHFQSIGSQMISTRQSTPYESRMVRSYPSLNLYGLQYIFYSRGRYYPSSYAASARSVERVEMAAPTAAAPPPPPPSPEVEEMNMMGDISPVSKAAADSTEEPEEEQKAEVVPRTNLDETVFFMPDLRTDEEGNIIVAFTMNEALTRWKFMGLAHTKDLKIGMTEREIVTQKELMVLPNPPRFLRQADELEITAKVTNLTENGLSGQAELQFFEATSMEAITEELLVGSSTIDFAVEGGRSSRLAWELKVPDDMTSALVYRIIARSEAFSDGEESALPVLSNRIFITESMPVTVKGGTKQVFELDRLEQVLNSKTATPQRLTMEITSNPSWLAIKALPYLMEYPHECTEQIFNRYYANSLAMGIANAHPRVNEIFQKWENTAALESELMKNEALKSAILEETPWVMDALAEEQQRKNMAILFDQDRMDNELMATLTKLSERQSADGGFPWFPGGRNSRYITQLIVEGLGHLEYLGLDESNEIRQAEQILSGAIAYIDQALQEEYQRLEENVEKGWTTFEANNLSYLAIHYLYSRSFFPDMVLPAATEPAYAYYTEQAEQYWLDQGFYQQGMIGLALHRMERPQVPDQIVASLKERALRSDEMGVYWNYGRSFWWYELPIETHSMLIELFAQLGDDPEMLDEMKIWLLRNKQTNSWETTKSTAAAVFALLNQGQGMNHIEESWLVEKELVKISFPELSKRDYRGKLEEAEAKAEPGTGYYQVNWDKEEMVPGLNKVKIKNKNKGISWGGLYWQYFEDLDQVKSFEDTPLQLKKQIYKEEITDKGPLLTEIKEGNALKPGNKLIVRIELRVDRDMEFVHMKDMRGSGLEPLEVFSNYKWQDGLGYYQSTKDVATNFFFDYLPKGTYVFEYPLRVIHKGNYSSGITSIQSMYAPEFTSHSGSVRLSVE
jgi:hypothetical protein